MRAATNAPLCSLQACGPLTPTPLAPPVALHDPGLPAIEEPAFTAPRAMLSIFQLEGLIKAAVIEYLANVAHRDRIIDSLGKVTVMTHGNAVNVTVHGSPGSPGYSFGFNLYDDYGDDASMDQLDQADQLDAGLDQLMAIKGFIKRMAGACGVDVLGYRPGPWATCCALDFDFYGMRTATRVTCILLGSGRLAPLAPLAELTSIDGFVILARASAS